jgi:hypothetical protein
MSSTNNISNATYLSWLQQTSNLNQQVGGNGGSSANSIGNSNFLDEIAQALEQSLPVSSSVPPAAANPGNASTNAILSANLSQAPEVAAQTFLQNLVVALGHDIVTTVSNSEAVTSDSNQPRLENLPVTAEIQNVLQQLTESIHVPDSFSIK